MKLAIIKIQIVQAKFLLLECRGERSVKARRVREVEFQLGFEGWIVFNRRKKQSGHINKNLKYI